jgi:hypothetical protein
MSSTELFAGTPYRTNDSGLRACRDEELEAWNLEAATDAQLLLSIVARRWALALTPPLVILTGLVVAFSHGLTALRVPGQMALPAFFVLSWAARLVLAARLARPFQTSGDPIADLRLLATSSPVARMRAQAARLAPWSRLAAMILSALAMPLVSLALMPYAPGAHNLIGIVVCATGAVALCGLWMLPPLFVRAFQIGFASEKRGFAPLTIVCALLWAGLSVREGGYFAVFAPVLVLASGGVMYFVFGLVERVLRRRFERDDALIAALLRRRDESAQ